ncbi:MULTISPECIES: glycosyltransferase [Citrobacter]|uniref:glycosyltransferase n=1 Tax=Citrobacter TaxID=544 RepID=UPI0005A7D67C|nr:MULTISPECIES: glycosyltransferase [Citrobacter]KSY30957.1 rhamnosyl transferase [Citrobacter sp. 50677481]MBJ9887664.1 glycosyltransferase [Citrobacter sedlakii]MCK8145005.1 glycosyltransferase [Citrobacter sedlakii]HCU0293896.1 glycosyltransferase [Citrobacter sedlakii]
MQDKTVTILMATYNGSAFIENQILSLQQQKYKNWILYIHDDGSSDNTLDIIKRMQLIDSRINLIEDGITGLGAGKNFLSLVKFSNTNYTIFCDQDDIWLENKLSSIIAYADNKGMGTSKLPSIVYADGYAFDDNTGHIDFSGISHNHANRLKDFLFFNAGYQGCSILFNKAMVGIVADYHGYVHLHDDVVSLVAHSMGHVYFLPKKLMLYRQHMGAVTGQKKFNNRFISMLTSKVNYLLSKEHFLVKRAFYENYYHLLTDDIKKDFEIFFKFCDTKSKFSQIIILLKHDFRLNNSRIKLLLKCIVRRTFSQ